MRMKVAQPGKKENAVRVQARPQLFHAAEKPQLHSPTTLLLNLQRTHGNRFVQRMLNGAMIQRKCACGGTCATCNPHTEFQRQDTIQSVLQHRGSGQPLEPGVRTFMEMRFGEDFSGVRVYTDTHAAQTAQWLNAIAYTIGRDIFFGASQYRPHTREGKRLLVHELTHVVQQTTSGSTSGGISSYGDPHEREADRVASAILSGQNTTVRSEPSVPFVQAQEGSQPTPFNLRLLPLPQKESQPAPFNLRLLPLPQKESQPTPFNLRLPPSLRVRRVCGPDVTDWLIAQMETNGKSAVVRIIREHNEASSGSLDERHIKALAMWAALVRAGKGPWDFKTRLGAPISGLTPCRQNCRGKTWSITLDSQCMTSEVAANIHFGYVGRLAGFSESTLLTGAGFAQLLEFRGETGDDPRDQQAIKKGFELFKAGSPRGLNKAGLEMNYYEKLRPGEGEPDGCEPCPTKVS